MSNNPTAFVGFVAKINTKSGTGSTGKPYTLHSMKLKDKDGAEIPGWFQCGFQAPACKEGDYVKVLGTPKGNNHDVVGKVLVHKNPPAAPPASNAPSGGGSARTAAPKTSELFGEIGGYNTEDDIRRMSYSAARSNALDAVALLLEAKALPLVAATTKAGAASRYDVVTAAIDKLTVEYFFDSASGRKLETVADTEISTEGDGPVPDEEEFGRQEEDEAFGDAEPEEFADDTDEDGFE